MTVVTVPSMVAVLHVVMRVGFDEGILRAAKGLLFMMSVVMTVIVASPT